MRSAAAQCELDGPRITGPSTSLNMLGYFTLSRYEIVFSQAPCESVRFLLWRNDMSYPFKRLIFWFLRFSGIAALFSWFCQKDRVSILLFHELDARVAEKAFQYFTKNYQIISLSQYMQILRHPHVKKIGRKKLILTFDDGHLSNYKLHPILQRFQMPISIFLCSSLIDTQRQYWFQFEGISEEVVQEMKRRSNAERVQYLEELGFTQTKEFAQPAALQAHHIRTMSDYVDFQAHTRFHPILPACDDDLAIEEIMGSKEELESKFGLSISSFAYPNGDYSLRDERIVKEAGFLCALTVDFGFNDANSDPYRLKRIALNDTKDLNEIVVKSTGLWAWIKTRNGRRQECGLRPVYAKVRASATSV